MNQHRIIKIGDAISQFINVTFLPRHRETTANESLSGRAHRMQWKKAEKVIDWVFYLWEEDHCKKAHLMDIQRAREWIDLHK